MVWERVRLNGWNLWKACQLLIWPRLTLRVFTFRKMKANILKKKKKLKVVSFFVFRAPKYSKGTSRTSSKDTWGIIAMCKNLFNDAFGKENMSDLFINLFLRPQGWSRTQTLQFSTLFWKEETWTLWSSFGFAWEKVSLSSVRAEVTFQTDRKKNKTFFFPWQAWPHTRTSETAWSWSLMP